MLMLAGDMRFGLGRMVAEWLLASERDKKEFEIGGNLKAGHSRNKNGMRSYLYLATMYCIIFYPVIQL
jgi:hypothetical protein